MSAQMEEWRQDVRLGVILTRLGMKAGSEFRKAEDSASASAKVVMNLE